MAWFGLHLYCLIVKQVVFFFRQTNKFPPRNRNILSRKRFTKWRNGQLISFLMRRIISLNSRCETFLNFSKSPLVLDILSSTWCYVYFIEFYKWKNLAVMLAALAASAVASYARWLDSSVTIICWERCTSFPRPWVRMLFKASFATADIAEIITG